jgi:hypothetical protein
MKLITFKKNIKQNGRTGKCIERKRKSKKKSKKKLTRPLLSASKFKSRFLVCGGSVRQ